MCDTPVTSARHANTRRRAQAGTAQPGLNGTTTHSALPERFGRQGSETSRTLTEAHGGTFALELDFGRYHATNATACAGVFLGGARHVHLKEKAGLSSGLVT